jgi:hypothetical protein
VLTALLLLLATVSTGSLPEIELAPKNDVLRIAVTGDTGEGADRVAKGIAKVHAATPLAAILLTGDNFYPCGPASERDPRWKLATPLTRIGVPVFPVLGNHDYCGKADPDAQIRATGVIANWRFPARQYVVRAGVADLAFVDTTPVVRGRTDHATPAIEATFADSKAPWRIVVGHHPVISSGYHGYFPRVEVARMRALIPKLRESRVDFFIGGHDHHVELIRGRMLHLISGAGSEPIPPIKLRTTTVFPEEIRFERIGFAVVEITKSEIRVRIYDGEGKARTGWIRGRKK